MVVVVEEEVSASSVCTHSYMLTLVGAEFGDRAVVPKLFLMVAPGPLVMAPH